MGVLHPVLQVVSGSTTEGSEVRYEELTGVQVDADLLVANFDRSVFGHAGLKYKVVHMHHFKTWRAVCQASCWVHLRQTTPSLRCS